MIAILNTGGANLNSIVNAVSRISNDLKIIDDPELLQKATSVIIPGVGVMDRVMDNIQRKELYESIRSLTVPTLGICIGMQIMFAESEEGREKGLSIFDSKIRKIKTQDKVVLPHMGWNKTFFSDCEPLFKGIKSGDYFYYVHSFMSDNKAAMIARSYYGEDITAAVKKDNFIGVQFHPEKSANNGNILLRNFLSL